MIPQDLEGHPKPIFYDILREAKALRSSSVLRLNQDREEGL